MIFHIADGCAHRRTAENVCSKYYSNELQARIVEGIDRSERTINIKHQFE